MADRARLSSLDKRSGRRDVLFVTRTQLLHWFSEKAEVGVVEGAGAGLVVVVVRWKMRIR